MSLLLQVEDYKLHSRLTIYEIEKEDFGMYKCVSKNSLGETESTLRLYGTKLLFLKIVKT
jgi:neurotrimin